MSSKNLNNKEDVNTSTVVTITKNNSNKKFVNTGFMPPYILQQVVNDTSQSEDVRNAAKRTLDEMSKINEMHTTKSVDHK